MELAREFNDKLLTAVRILWFIIVVGGVNGLAAYGVHVCVRVRQGQPAREQRSFIWQLDFIHHNENFLRRACGEYTLLSCVDAYVRCKIVSHTDNDEDIGKLLLPIVHGKCLS